ncbi:uncharacterized protein [Phyllobates terribilis]|uniref:uncharacterized protein isoform X1 n=2 Tax=Phyllobates terribilis TaxID=111132 RepID=UPI003CCB1285
MDRRLNITPEAFNQLLKEHNMSRLQFIAAYGLKPLVYIPELPLNAKVVFLILYIIIFVLALFGNSLVVYIIIRKKAMRTATNIFICSLACSDLLVTFFCIPFTLLQNISSEWLGDSMPQELQPLRVSRPCLNLLLMTCLNLLHYNVEQERLRRRRRPKKIWVHPILQERTDKGHFNVLYQDLRSFPEKFKQFCRLNIIAFDRLLSLMSPDLDFQDTVMRRAISAEERLLITLRFLATGESYTSLHLQFRVGKSTISRIVRCTCTVIWQKLQPIVMPSPTEETWLQVAAGFQTVANFPNCIGAVDGKHVRVQQPPRSGSRFFNYKKFFSVVLMAVADAHFKFVAIDVGAYGSTGDSRVFRSSQIGLQILQDGVTLPAPRPLPGSTHPVPFVMVSDEAFPLQTNLLRPYPRRALNARRRIFNYRLSRARRYVECTFGIMCSQWRIFHTAIQLDTETVDTVIKACCVLHNYAREYSTEQDEESQLSELIPVVNSGQGRPSNSGARVRETFADYFMSPEGAVHWQYSCAGVEQPDQQRRSDEQ